MEGAPQIKTAEQLLEEKINDLSFGIGRLDSMMEEISSSMSYSSPDEKKSKIEEYKSLEADRHGRIDELVKVWEESVSK